MSASISNRYDFVLFFDVQDGNPNGDPDAGNQPRIDAETGMGLVTDVCLKRKVRNFVQITQVDKEAKPIPRFDIYVKERAVLGRAHVKAFEGLGIPLGETSKREISLEFENALEEIGLPEGLSIEEPEEEGGKTSLVVAADADLKALKEFVKESKPSKELKKYLAEAFRGIKSRKPTSEESEKGKAWMCNAFYDIRTFGAVLSLKSAPNCGQVRGPVQLTFGRSVEPVVALEHSITRMAVATEAEAEKQGGDNRTMGRKFTIPYGLYRAHGFISPHLAAQTGFSQEDLDLLWKALQEMFEHDRSAARGLMSTRRLIIFKHPNALGVKPAQELFASVTCDRATSGPARSFADYIIRQGGKPLEKIASTLGITDVKTC